MFHLILYDAYIRIFVRSGARARTSYSNLSPNPGRSVVPPDKTIFENSVVRKSISDCRIEVSSKL